MWLVQNSNPVPTLPNRYKIEQFIDSSLLGNWTIRIEHSLAGGSQGKAIWRQWGTTLFAITSARAVLEAIDACHARYPSHEIRIHAERLKPEMRMVYCVYRAADARLTTRLTKGTPIKNAPIKTAPVKKAPINREGQPVAMKQDWIQLPDEKDDSKGDTKWGFLAVAGALAGTLLAWEAA